MKLIVLPSRIRPKDVYLVRPCRRCGCKHKTWNAAIACKQPLLWEANRADQGNAEKDKEQ